MIIESIIAMLAPAGVDAIKSLAGGLSRKFAGLSVEDEIKLGEAQTEKLKALAALDTVTGSPSQWVVDTRASFRYIAAGVSIVGGLVGLFMAPILADLWTQLITLPFSFIFGERMYLNLKK